MLPIFSVAQILTAPAHAQSCQEESIWYNDKAEIGDIAKISLKHPCPLGHPPLLRLKVETKCFPRLCTWGWKDGRFMDDNTINAFIQTFSASRFVEIEKLQETMRVVVKNDYNQPGRSTDYLRATLYRSE